MCGLPYVLNCLFGTYGANPSGSRPSPSLPFSFPLLFCYLFFLSSYRTPLKSPSLLHHLFFLSFVLFSLIFIHFLCLCLILSPSFTFLVPSLHYAVPHSYDSSITTVLFSLVSNHTHLEPAQFSSSTHGNHLKLLGWSPPLFLCPLFSYFSSFSISPIPDPFCLSAHYTLLSIPLSLFLAPIFIFF